MLAHKVVVHVGRVRVCELQVAHLALDAYSLVLRAVIPGTEKLPYSGCWLPGFECRVTPLSCIIMNIGCDVAASNRIGGGGTSWHVAWGSFLVELS